jgi:hypothetical protein
MLKANRLQWMRLSPFWSQIGAQSESDSRTSEKTTHGVVAALTHGMRRKAGKCTRTAPIQAIPSVFHSSSSAKLVRFCGDLEKTHDLSKSDSLIAPRMQRFCSQICKVTLLEKFQKSWRRAMS